jgi:hypothetical protein
MGYFLLLLNFLAIYVGEKERREEMKKKGDILAGCPSLL